MIPGNCNYESALLIALQHWCQPTTSWFICIFFQARDELSEL